MLLPPNHILFEPFQGFLQKDLQLLMNEGKPHFVNQIFQRLGILYQHIDPKKEPLRRIENTEREHIMCHTPCQPQTTQSTQTKNDTLRGFSHINS